MSQRSLAQTTASNKIDWDRIEALEPLVLKVSRTLVIHHQAASPLSTPDDVASVVRLKLIEIAQRNPDLFAREDRFVVRCAMNRAIDTWRRDLTDKHTLLAEMSDECYGAGAAKSVESDLIERDERADELDRMTTVIGGLVGQNALIAEIMAAVREGGETMLIGDGKLNVAALARHMGRPRQTIQYTIAQMRMAYVSA